MSSLNESRAERVADFDAALTDFRKFVDKMILIGLNSISMDQNPDELRLILRTCFESGYHMGYHDGGQAWSRLHELNKKVEQATVN